MYAEYRIHCDAATTGVSEVKLCLKFKIWQNTKAGVHLVEISSVFNLVDKTAKCVSILFSVVRLHLTEQNDPLATTGRRLSVAALSYDCVQITFLFLT